MSCRAQYALLGAAFAACWLLVPAASARMSANESCTRLQAPCRVAAALGQVAVVVEYASRDEVRALVTISRLGRTSYRRLTYLGESLGSVAVVRLEKGREPAVVIGSNVGGGNHCCGGMFVFRYRGGAYGRREFALSCGALPAQLLDLDRDRVTELRGCDGRMWATFEQPAQSWPPIRVWQIRGWRATTVTKQFPAAVAQDARRARTFSANGNPAALLGWLADEYLLGRADEAWARARRTYRQSFDFRECVGRGDSSEACVERFVQQARGALRRYGYLR